MYIKHMHVNVCQHVHVQALQWTHQKSEPNSHAGNNVTIHEH